MSPHVHFDHGGWEFPASLTLTLLLAASLYLRWWISARAVSAVAIPTWKASSFLLGLVLVWMAWGSPLAAYDHSLLTVHMIKHLLLMTIAPALIPLGEPGRVFWSGMPLFAQHSLRRVLRQSPLRRFARMIARPELCWSFSALTLVVWHIPALFTLCVRSVLVACYSALAKCLNWPTMVAALVPLSGDSAVRHPFRISRLL